MREREENKGQREKGDASEDCSAYERDGEKKYSIVKWKQRDRQTDRETDRELVRQEINRQFARAALVHVLYVITTRTMTCSYYHMEIEKIIRKDYAYSCVFVWVWGGYE